MTLFSVKNNFVELKDCKKQYEDANNRFPHSTMTLSGTESLSSYLAQSGHAKHNQAVLKGI